MSNKTSEATGWQFLCVLFFLQGDHCFANLHNFTLKTMILGLDAWQLSGLMVWMPWRDMQPNIWYPPSGVAFHISSISSQWNWAIATSPTRGDVYDCTYLVRFWRFLEVKQNASSAGSSNLAHDAHAARKYWRKLCHNRSAASASSQSHPICFVNSYQFLSWILQNSGAWSSSKLTIKYKYYTWIRIIRANTTSKSCFFSVMVWVTGCVRTRCHQTVPCDSNSRPVIKHGLSESTYHSIPVSFGECPNRMQAWLIRQMTYLEREAQMDRGLLAHLCCPYLETQLPPWCISCGLYTYLQSVQITFTLSMYVYVVCTHVVYTDNISTWMYAVDIL